MVPTQEQTFLIVFLIVFCVGTDPGAPGNSGSLPGGCSGHPLQAGDEAHERAERGALQLFCEPGGRDVLQVCVMSACLSWHMVISLCPSVEVSAVLYTAPPSTVARTSYFVACCGVTFSHIVAYAQAQHEGASRALQAGMPQLGMSVHA